MKKKLRYPPNFLPPLQKNEHIIQKALEFHWDGEKTVFFPQFLKLSDTMLSAVLYQFSDEERKLLQSKCNIPWEETKPSLFGIKIKKAFNIEFDNYSSNEENEEIADVLCKLSKENFTIGNVIPFYLNDLSSFIQGEGNRSDKYKAIVDCIFELLALCKEADMDGEPHNYAGQEFTKKAKEDYCHLLIAYACREYCISAYQLHYLECIVRQFCIQPQWFQETLRCCLDYNAEERKDNIFEIIDNYSRLDDKYTTVLLEDCLALEILCNHERSKSDKVDLPKFLCKDKKYRKELKQIIKHKLEGAK